MHRTQRFPIEIALLAAALLLAACGGGGGGGGSHTAATSTALGTRSVPGGSIAVTANSPVAAGGSASLHVSVALPTTPSVVRAGIGAEYDADDPGVVAVATAPGQYDVTVPVPTQLPAGSRAWVRVVMPDGSIVESGTSDFLLR